MRIQIVYLRLYFVSKQGRSCLAYNFFTKAGLQMLLSNILYSYFVKGNFRCFSAHSFFKEVDNPGRRG